MKNYGFININKTKNGSFVCIRKDISIYEAYGMLTSLMIQLEEEIKELSGAKK